MTALAPHASRTSTDVLRLAGPGRPGHLDPVCVDDPATAALARLSTRCLFGYVGDPDPLSWRPTTPVADLAATVPSIYNAGVGASNRSLVVMLRPGALWDTTPHRPVTAHDVVRGIKRLGNPVHRPAALPYLTAMIRGMAEFCAGYAELPPDATAAELAAYQDDHDIAGLLVLDDETVVFELTRPALDLPHLLALPCTAPAPAEYDAFVPGSAELRAHLRSTGPYRPMPGEASRWEPNPAWRAESDPVRSRHLSGIRVDPGPADAGELARQVRAGTIDLAWNRLAVTGPAREPVNDPAYALDPCLVLNVHGQDPAIRRAVAGAIDHDVRAAVADIAVTAEPGRHALVASSLIPPGNDGHLPEHPGFQPGENRRPDTTLTLIHRGTGTDSAVAGTCAAALRRAGIEVRLVEVDRSPRDAGQEWDIALTSLHPAWPRLNSRVFVQALAEGYDPVRPIVDRAMDTAADPPTATTAWREAEQRLLDDGVVVPLLFRTRCAPPLTSDRVLDAVTLPSLAHEVDLTALQVRRDVP